MPQIANVVIADGKATPVSHTFSPQGIIGPVGTLEDRAGGVIVGYNRLNASFTPASKTGKVHKARFVLALPTLETLGNSSTGFTPPATKAYEHQIVVEFFLPIRGLLAERHDLRILAMNMLNSALLTAMVENAEGVY